MSITGLGSLSSAYLNKQPRLEIYEDKTTKEFRWKIWMSSDIVGASSEGYSTRAKCIANLVAVEQHIKYLRENQKLV